MTNNRHKSHNNNEYDLTGYTCAGKGCNNLATYSLKIVIIKRTGDFCTTCKKDLEEKNLVISYSKIRLGFGKGEFIKFPIEGKNAIEQRTQQEQN